MNVALSANAFTVRLRFHGDLSFFLRTSQANPPQIEKRLAEKTSVKDAIESCGIPHTEVDLIVINGAPVGFSHHLVAEQEIDLYPVVGCPESFPAHRLQDRGVKRFVADGHLGKLVRDLRLFGIDVLYDNVATDAELVITATTHERAVLTRDRRLLMHAAVRHGYCPRSHDPDEQIIEVIRRFDLAERIALYTRCLQCNGFLEPVDKTEVFEQLEPLTRIYYDDFRRCAECRKIYWPGSHFAKLQNRLERIRSELNRKSELGIRNSK
jgi:uncharacterized protein with PIN domain